MTHGETFLGSRDGQILLSVGAANWQIVAKSRLKGINVWGKKYCLWHTRLASKCSVIDSVHQKHASVTKWPVSLFSSCVDNSNTHKYAGLAPVCLCVCKSALLHILSKARLSPVLTSTAHASIDVHTITTQWWHSYTVTQVLHSTQIRGACVLTFMLF